MIGGTNNEVRYFRFDITSIGFIKCTEILSEGFPFIRIDFYEVGDQVIFGEATFFPESGKGRFTPEEFNKELGSYLKLPTN